MLIYHALVKIQKSYPNQSFYWTAAEGGVASLLTTRSISTHSASAVFGSSGGSDPSATPSLLLLQSAPLSLFTSTHPSLALLPFAYLHRATIRKPPLLFLLPPPSSSSSSSPLSVCPWMNALWLVEHMLLVVQYPPSERGRIHACVCVCVCVCDRECRGCVFMCVNTCVCVCSLKHMPPVAHRPSVPWMDWWSAAVTMAIGHSVK